MPSNQTKQKLLNSALNDPKKVDTALNKTTKSFPRTF